MKKKSPCSKEFLLKSSWPKPNFLPGLKYFLAQHLVETQICTLSKIFLDQKVDLESGHVPVRQQTEVPPSRAQDSQIKRSSALTASQCDAQATVRGYREALRINSFSKQFKLATKSGKISSVV